ncbi:LytR/AlgR family response regulator transcription factor [Tenacibaculum ovolyticum]|uniref:LytR/AlgR family response regulator transcription factor n=1 Tax=Tenacibaculum ovolyticum TaxID=104270 RepID=UPI0007ED181C|nr:LytTR family DNA-binding domain-containing protein [Tenacibaculum ovolyticum]
MFNCIIIEDQPPAQRILKRYISTTESIILKETFTDALKAKDYLKKEKIDLIFLDIHLPKISGIDFLKSMPNHPKVILTTAFSDYALESYQFNVIDYLLKPISQERFLQAISKLHILETKEHLNIPLETIIIKSGHELIKLKTSDIIYIKADSDYTEIMTEFKKHLSKESLKHWLDKLDETSFCQVHRSYLLNINYLVKISGNIIHLKTGTIPLGRAYKKKFVTNFLK